MLNQEKSIESRSISWEIPTILIVVVFVIVLSFVFRGKPQYVFERSVEDMHQELLKSSENTVNLDVVAKILQGNQSNRYQFIDLRNPNDFIRGHLPNAINIPTHRLLDEEFKSIFKASEGKINILYYSEHTGACAPWMLLWQMGYKNNKLMLGGYELVKTTLLDTVNTKQTSPFNERAKYDYAKIVEKTQGAGSGASSVIPKSAPVIEKRKKKVVQGGC